MWSAAKLKRFRTNLLTWFSEQKRDLPWRRTKDAYAIWVSEIMLQQTRVTAAIPYYERFLARFPNFAALAVAGEEDVLRHWAGLGYYYRARNLQKAAQRMGELGAFPKDYDTILSLPGVGDYTAAAVASIAFELPHAVVDGNVVRVISRLMASDPGRKQIIETAGRLLDRLHAGDFNQAMMELGATVCLPKNPHCLLCPVAKLCRARELGVQDQFPTPKVKGKNKQIERSLFWIERRGKVLAWQRPAHARLMPGFWELPEQEQLPAVSATEELGAFRHGITFHDYQIKLWRAMAPAEFGGCQWLDIGKLTQLPLSTIFKKALNVRNKYVGK